eukprot:c56877_g1_i1.p1 GENE.c56877_g1_i1~~c56877_g1_i1.p1  ORF type:complete len:239 (+),score=49.73 c56877_g1_i1:131-847(+)
MLLADAQRQTIEFQPTPPKTAKAEFGDDECDENSNNDNGNTEENEMERKVIVHVGESVFCTTVETLTRREPDSLFQQRVAQLTRSHAMTFPLSRRTIRSRKLSTSPPCFPSLNPSSTFPESSQAIELWFDRNPSLFLVILNYLRTGDAPLPAKLKHLTHDDLLAKANSLLALHEEAKFYKCVRLACRVEAALHAVHNALQPSPTLAERRHPSSDDDKSSDHSEVDNSHLSESLFFALD